MRNFEQFWTLVQIKLRDFPSSDILWIVISDYDFVFLLSDAKAREAASSAYYSPSAPHNVYMPQQFPSGAPPAYTDVVNKKNQ
jgi:hypothetical protein